jgi:hypothetical protein
MALARAMSSLVTPERAETTMTRLVALVARRLDALCHILDAIDVTHGGAAVFLDDKSHG